LSTAARRALLLAPPVAFLALFFAWPVAAIVGEGLRSGGAWSSTGLQDVLGDPALRGVVWFTVWQAAASTILASILVRRLLKL